MDRLSLETRKMLIEALLKKENDIRKINQDVVDRIVKELIKRESDGTIYEYLEQLDVHLKNEAVLLEKELNKTIETGIALTISAGIYQSKQTTLSILDKANIEWQPISRIYFRVHNEAVEEMKQRTIKGLHLSDRIWGNSNKTMDSIGVIIQEAIKEGLNPVEVADLLERYVREGAHTLAVEYPNMFERLSVPMDLNYESLRLARTEMAAAFGEVKKKSAKVNPANKGIKWNVSNAGVTCDLCKANEECNSGMGPGVYTIDNLPEYPAHPNCLCHLTEVVEDIDDFIDRLIEWNKNPLSQPDIEEWYQTVYKQGMVS